MNESKQNTGFSIFFGILATVSAFGFFNIGALSGIGWGVLAVAYIGIGSVYSLWRWHRHAVTITKEFNKRTDGMTQTGAPFSTLREAYLNDTNFRKNKPTLGYWFAMWPLNGIAHLAGDLVIAVEKFLTTFVGGIYDQISERARRDANIDLNKY